VFFFFLCNCDVSCAVFGHNKWINKLNVVWQERLVAVQICWVTPRHHPVTRRLSALTSMPTYLLNYLSYTHAHTFNGPFPGLPGWAGTRKVKPVWILLKQETVSGSGISWATYKFASRSRQITMPASHHSKFSTGWMPFLPPNQQRQSTEGKSYLFTNSVVGLLFLRWVAR